MPSVCFYFQVHQPYRLRRYGVFDVGRRHDYFDDQANQSVLRKVATKCYLPMNALLHELVERHRGRFRIAFSITGTALEQLERWAPEALESFQALARTGCVELLGETYYHSLSALESPAEFSEQLERHADRTQALFGARPTTFRNTELIYSNALPASVRRHGFRAVLAEGADRVLGWRSPNFVYQPPGEAGLRLLLKNYRLSDDVAFRFGQQSWSGYPLTAEKFAGWVHAIAGCGEVVNLFMDYETFGEHQWAETGIFEFMRHLPSRLLDHPETEFVTPAEAAARYAPKGEIDVPSWISWADVERDLTAWLGNDMQRSAHRSLYALREAVRAAGDPELCEDWRRLTTSDHFYYMCTKWFADGDVHKYFSPYESPYEAHIAFMNACADLALRVKAGCNPVTSS
jgi:alpha-amylase